MYHVLGKQVEDDRRNQCPVEQDSSFGDNAHRVKDVAFGENDRTEEHGMGFSLRCTHFMLVYEIDLEPWVKVL